jgi:SAM-dependent methyltransferase
MVRAECSLCATSYDLDTRKILREGKLCPGCGSSGRAQAISYCLAKYVFGHDGPLCHVKKTKTKIVGLSDGPTYSAVLAKKCNYVNTYYHTQPFLDITDPQDEHIGQYDALISADVFEHVLGHPSNAFRGANKVLKKGGYLILTVPFINKGDHKEHYPGLQNYTAEQVEDGQWVAHLEYTGGLSTTEKKPCFHGGPGKTLEIRLFNRERIEEELFWAGFRNVKVHTQNMPERGINWTPPSRIITAQKAF